jgi:hypothetical protein
VWLRHRWSALGALVIVALVGGWEWLVGGPPPAESWRSVGLALILVALWFALTLLYVAAGQEKPRVELSRRGVTLTTPSVLMRWDYSTIASYVILPTKVGPREVRLLTFRLDDGRLLDFELPEKLDDSRVVAALQGRVEREE